MEKELTEYVCNREKSQLVKVEGEPDALDGTVLDEVREEPNLFRSSERCPEDLPPGSALVWLHIYGPVVLSNSPHNISTGED